MPIVLTDYGVCSDALGNHRLRKKAISSSSNKTSSATLSLMATLSESSIQSDPLTAFPQALDFTLWSKGKHVRPISVRVTYSDYRLVDGVQIPHHIRKFLSGILFYDIVISSAQIK